MEIYCGICGEDKEFNLRQVVCTVADLKERKNVERVVDLYICSCCGNSVDRYTIEMYGVEKYKSWVLCGKGLADFVREYLLGNRKDSLKLNGEIG